MPMMTQLFFCTRCHIPSMARHRHFSTIYTQLNSSCPGARKTRGSHLRSVYRSDLANRPQLRPQKHEQLAYTRRGAARAHFRWSAATYQLRTHPAHGDRPFRRPPGTSHHFQHTQKESCGRAPGRPPALATGAHTGAPTLKCMRLFHLRKRTRVLYSLKIHQQRCCRLSWDTPVRSVCCCSVF